LTVLVGVRCTDGVVIGCDSIATSSMGQFPLIHLPFDGKIRVFPSNVIVACTGAIGFAQRLHEHVEAAIKGGVFSNLVARECTANISKRFLTDLVGSMAQIGGQNGVGFGALIAAHLKDGPILIEYGTNDFQPEIKTEKLFFVSMGSGQVLADPFLAFVSKVLWKSKMPTVDEAKLGVYWVLDHTIKLAPGKVGPPLRLATLRITEGKWIAAEQDTQEFAQYVEELENHIGEFIRAPIEEARATSPPSVPPGAT
jgi:20S proteasome alpha/beta subunit